MANNLIQLDGYLEQVQSNLISEYSTTTVVQLSDELDHAIDSTAGLGILTLTFTIFPESVSSSLQFGNARTVLYLTAEDIPSTSSVGDPIFSQTIFADDLESTLLFGTAKTVMNLYPDSLINENNFSEDAVLNQKIYANSVPTTTSFGWDEPLVDMQIWGVTSVEPTTVVPSPNVLKVIGPLGIGSTTNFGVPVFTDNIHRLLVFKDDNLTKVGELDAVVVAGGIRINPSIAKSEVAYAGDASLPSKPVGFISVNIDGNDFKIPYYNS